MGKSPLLFFADALYHIQQHTGEAEVDNQAAGVHDGGYEGRCHDGRIQLQDSCADGQDTTDDFRQYNSNEKAEYNGQAHKCLAGVLNYKTKEIYQG